MLWGQEAASKAIAEAKIKVAQATRDGDIGAAEAARDQRIQVSSANAKATEGENNAAVEIASSNSARRIKEAEAERQASAAEKVQAAAALREAYAAEKLAEEERATREKSTKYADIVVPAEIEKQKIETLAEAEAEKIRRLKKGEADGIQSMLEGEAKGVYAMLSQKGEGFAEIVKASGNDAKLASLLLVIEQLPKLVEEQVKAISNLKIDKVTVWDSGGGKNGKSSTADFVSSLAGSLPPLHEITKNAGIELPEFLGKIGNEVISSEKKQESTQEDISDDKWKSKIEELD